MKFVKHIKIRVGEPLVSVSVNSSGVAFGSISGYIGYYSFDRKEVVYVKEVFDELIRAIYLPESNIACVCIGDLTGQKVDFRDLSRIDMTSVRYDRVHSSTVCANTIPMLYKQICLLVTFPSANYRDSVEVSTKCSVLKMNFNDSKNENLNKISMAQHSVPFHFDGTHLVWLEYIDKVTKKLNQYDTAAGGTQEEIYTFDKGFEFVSHVRKCRKEIILVKNHKKVQRLDMNTSKLESLYEHGNQVIALDLWQTAAKEGVVQQDVRLDVDKKDEEEKTNIIVTKSEASDYSIVSIDDRETVKYWKQGKVQATANVRSISGFPDIARKSYLFDMGYPYFVAQSEKHFAFTSDQGNEYVHR